MTPELFQFRKIADGVVRIEPARYPATPGLKRDGTSQDAAPSAQDARILRDKVYDTLRQRKRGHDDSSGLTADECAALLGLSILSVRPRFSELVALGKIKETSQRRRNASGKMAVVWTAT